MRVGVIGAGPTGLVLGMGLARRGHDVTLVDRDPGPAADGSWARRGVMQFHHAHAFRSQVSDVLQAEAPAAHDAWLELGAEPVMAPEGGPLVGVRSRRETFERAVRQAAQLHAGVTLRQGHVDEVIVRNGRAVGLLVDGRRLDADLVVDASGRAGRVTDRLGEREQLGGSCGVAYVDRVYRRRPGAELGPMTSPLSFVGKHDGYLVLVFPHDQGYFSVIVIRASKDKELARLRENAVFDRACATVPSLSAWTDPELAEAVTSVLPGGNLLNVYRSQRRPDGQPVLPGLVFAGDSVCTTTPNFGRGVATSLLQVAELLRLLDEHGDGHAGVDGAATVYADWCDTGMRSWVVDHVEIDGAMARRWAGHDIDLDARIPSDLVMDAASQDPVIAEALPRFASMQAGPETLDPVRERARAVYAGGWRPPYGAGPTRDELVEVLSAP